MDTQSLCHILVISTVLNPFFGRAEGKEGKGEHSLGW